MPKVFEPLTKGDREDLAALQYHWDQMRRHKLAYRDLLVKVSDRLTPVQISRHTDLTRQHVVSQLRHLKR